MFPLFLLKTWRRPMWCWWKGNSMFPVNRCFSYYVKQNSLLGLKVTRSNNIQGSYYKGVRMFVVAVWLAGCLVAIYRLFVQYTTSDHPAWTSFCIYFNYLRLSWRYRTPFYSLFLITYNDRMLICKTHSAKNNCSSCKLECLSCFTIVFQSVTWENRFTSHIVHQSKSYRVYQASSSQLE